MLLAGHRHVHFAIPCVRCCLRVAVRAEKAQIGSPAIQVIAIYMLNLQGKWLSLPLRTLATLRATMRLSDGDECSPKLVGPGPSRPAREDDKYRTRVLNSVAASGHPALAEMRGIQA